MNQLKPKSNQMRHFAITLFFVLPLLTFAQNQLTDSLRYSRDTKKVYQGTRKMTMDDLFLRMRPYPTTFKLIESARDCNFYSNIFAFAGGLPIGYAVVEKLLYNRTNWAVLGTGIGLVAISIPLDLRHKKQLQRAVLSFNTEAHTTTQLESKYSLSLSANATGIGLRLNF